jgi:hypothetical protein
MSLFGGFYPRTAPFASTRSAGYACKTTDSHLHAVSGVSSCLQRNQDESKKGGVRCACEKHATRIYHLRKSYQQRSIIRRSYRAHTIIFYSEESYDPTSSSTSYATKASQKLYTTHATRRTLHPSVAQAKHTENIWVTRKDCG